VRPAPESMITRRLLLGALGAAAASACRRASTSVRPRSRAGARPPAQGQTPATEGLSPATALVTIDAVGRAVRLDAAQSRPVLDAVWQILGGIPSVEPVASGARFLAELRLNEQVVDVAIWKPQRLVVAARRLSNVSAVVVPVTGAWRHRVLIVQLGRVVASPRLLESQALATLDRAVDAAVGLR
jgi:hypothetical protein